jgi:3',5'-cyclic AMP phosphodiesterase CpdA
MPSDSNANGPGPTTGRCVGRCRDVVRVLHLSDVHFPLPFTRLELRRLLGKRALGAANLLLNRSRHFERAGEKLASLAAFADSTEVDLVIFTGDCTNLGTEPEFAAARDAIDGLTRAPMGFIPIPGNHDLYLKDSVEGRLFETYFGDFLSSDLDELSGSTGWPVVRLISDSIAVIAVNSSRPNPLPWASNGRVPDDQLSALGRALNHEKVADRFVFVITHFAPRRMDGTPDLAVHGFDNGEEFLGTCAGLRRGAILHGHIHRRYYLRVPGVNPSIFNAGSATYAGREGIWLFEVTADGLRAFPGRWTGEGYLVDRDAVIQMACC